MIEHIQKVKGAERLLLGVRGFRTFRFLDINQKLNLHVHKHVHSMLDACLGIKKRKPRGGWG
jgi:hypothetical protein